MKYTYCTKGKPYLYRVDDDNNFELTNTLRQKTYEYVKDYNEQNGKVIGEFICDKVIKTCGWRLRGNTQQCAKRTRLEEIFPHFACLTIDEIVKYAGGENREVCGWVITDLKIYDKPKELSEFTRPCSYDGICFSCKRFIANGMPYGFCDSTITRPPQSYMRVEELGE